MVVVDDYPGALLALDWVTVTAPDHSMRVTFVHVLDSRHLYQSVAWGGLPLIEVWRHAQVDGERLMARLRTIAPDSVSVTTRMLVAPISRARQILRAVDESPSCDVLVIATPVRRSRFDSTARLCNWLRRRSPVPVLVPSSLHPLFETKEADHEHGL
jgi:nucleotide-binding universal stress UspA family protein